MKTHLLLTGLLAVSLLTACEKEAEKEDSASKFAEITAPFLTASDFAQGSEDQTSADDITAKLLDADELWDNHPDADSGSSALCMNNFKIRSVGANKVSIGGSDDIAACMQENYGASGVTFTSASIKYYMEVECAGVDLSGMDGMPVTDQNIATLVATCGQAMATSMYQVDSTTVGSFTYMGQTFAINTQVKSATMNPDGTGCVDTYSAGDWTSTCTIYNKIVSNSEGQTETTLITMGFNNRVQTEGSTAPFYKSGTVDLYVNGWDGTVTYNGPNTNASFSITHGAETKTGQLTTSGGVMTQSLNPMAVKLQNAIPSVKKIFSLKLN